MSFFGKNIRKIRGVKGLSQQAFAEIFNLKRATLGAYEEQRSEPKIETIIKIADYFSISVDDLLTSKLTVNKLSKFKDNLALGTEDKEVFTQIPCITKKTISNYLLHYNKENYIKSLPKIHLPVSIDDSLIAYTVMNLEMAKYDNGLYPKDIVIGKLIKKELFKNLSNGCMVLVLVKNELILRRLHRDENLIVLRADHKNIVEKTFKIDQIIKLWKIDYVFFNRVPKNEISLKDKLLFLEKEFLKLKNN